MKNGVIAQRLGLPLEASIDAAARIGVDGVQLYSVSRTESLLDYDAARRAAVVRRCRDAGVAIAAICGEVGGFGFRLAECNPERIALSCRNLDLALELGCRIVTSHIGVVRSDRDDELVKQQRAALAEVGAYAARHGACFAIETGPEPATVLRQLLDDIASPGLGINLDPANLVMVLAADPVAAVQVLGDAIVHTHAKDGVHCRKCDPERVYDAFARGGIRQLAAETGELFREVPLGEGGVAWPAYLNSLRSVGFDGYLTIEREIGLDPLQRCAAAVQFLRRQLDGPVNPGN